MKSISLDLSKPGDFEVDGMKFDFGPKVCSGDLADFYSCKLHQQPTHKVDGNRFAHILEDDVDVTNALLKVTQDPIDNDLADNEVTNLTKLFPAKAKDEKFYRYLPQRLANFTVNSRGRELRALVLPFMEGYVNLGEVHKAHPVLDFRDVVWMFKRTLVGIGFAHINGIIHGAILPPHVMVHPIDHGAKILDWSYSSTGGPIRAMSRAFQDFYAPEILDKQDPRASTDIYMAAKCAIYLMGGDLKTNVLPTTVPDKIRDFYLECVHPDRYMRPQNAWDLHESFDNLLQDVVGKPTYRRLDMP